MRVTIIGCGFSGSVLALHLKRQNPPIDSTIYESSFRNDRNINGSVTLTANALSILDELGIYKEIRLKGCDCERISLCDQSLKVIGSLYNGDEKNHGYTALRVERKFVIEALERMLESMGVKVVYGMTCTKIVEMEEINKVNVSFQTGKVVSGEYVVGADGVNSVVRRFVEKGSDARYIGKMNLGSIIKKDKVSSHIFDLIPFVAYGSRGTISLIPSRTEGDEVGLFATANYQDVGDKGWENVEKERLKVILGGVYCMNDWPKGIRDMVKSLDPERLYCWPHYTIPDLTSYNSESGNITLIGEAAHSMPITGGQEVAMAIEDAASLAHVLGRCNSGQLRKNLLGIWERHRLQRIEWVAIYSARTANYVQNMKPKGWAQMFKEWTMWTCIWWLGEDGGMRWVYDYKADSVLPALVRA